MNLTAAPCATRELAGRSKPYAFRTAALSAAACPLRHATVARPSPVSSVMTRLGSPSPWRPGTAMPESAERGWRVRSDTEAISLRIDVAGRADLHLDVAAPHWIVGTHDLAVPLRAIGQK